MTGILKGGEQNIMFKTNKRGFTLVELLVVIAIIGILAAVVVVALNPVEMMRKGRDSTRLSDMDSIRKAVDLAIADGASLDNTSCSTQAGSVPPAPCNSIDQARTVTGTGWVNVDVSTFLPTLPIDPRAADGTYTDGAAATVNAQYEFGHDGSMYELRCHFESSANTSAAAGIDRYTTDGGDDAGWYEVGTSLTIL